MKAYVRFGPDDAGLLLAFWSSLKPRTKEVADVFYDRILEFDEARAVFEDLAQVRRLKATLQVWLEEMMCGPHDHAYHARRRAIGDRHIQVGLPHRYMFTAMAVVQAHLCRIAAETYGPQASEALCAAIHKISTLDLAIMTGTFMGRQVEQDVQETATVIVAHLPAPALLLDAEGRVVTATDEARRVLGQEIVGRTFHEVLPRDLVERTDLDQAVSRAIREREGFDVPRVDVPVDGADRSWRVRVVPIDHPRIKVMMLADEITATLAAEAQQRRMETLAQIGAMSAAVAHELRNPLAGISGAIQVMSGSMATDDPRRSVMSKVRDQVDRLDRMVRDLLAFSRPVQPRLQTVDLLDVARVVAENLGRDLDQGAISLRGEGRALADPDLVHRVVLNLVQNALSMAPGVRVEIEVAPGQLRVRDDGPGVPAEVRARVFEPFFTTRTTGTGLGLAICRSVAEAMGGTVDLEDTPRGACFVLRLLAVDLPEAR